MVHLVNQVIVKIINNIVVVSGSVFYVVMLQYCELLCQVYLSNDILYIFVSYILSEILLKKQKVFTLIIHSTRALVYTKKKYIPVGISPYLVQIHHVMDNKLAIQFVFSLA